MTKVKLEEDLCVGCGMCAQQNPKYFEFTDEGLSRVFKEDVDKGDEESINDSVELCPTDAISIFDNEKNINEE